jgi:LysR family transcriptional regulator, flagellar master operon regulator
MDISLARTFLSVVETGSFVEAGARLHITQSTVSARIRNLETQIGKPLFERSKAGARLTPAGEQFHKHALALVRVWEHARLEVSLAEQHRAHVAVGGQMSLWNGFLLNWIAWLRGASPDVAITASVGFSSVLMERIGEGTLDLAVLYRPVQKAGIVIEHLFDEELVMVSSGDGGEGQIGKDYAFLNWGPEFQADHAMAFPNLSHPGLYLDLGSVGVSYLLENRASGYFPVRIARPHIEAGRLHVVKRTPRFVYPVYAVYPEQRDEAAFEPLLQGLRQVAEQL